MKGRHTSTAQFPHTQLRKITLGTRTRSFSALFSKEQTKSYICVFTRGGNFKCLRVTSLVCDGEKKGFMAPWGRRSRDSHRRPGPADFYSNSGKGPAPLSSTSNSGDGQESERSGAAGLQGGEPGLPPHTVAPLAPANLCVCVCVSGLDGHRDRSSSALIDRSHQG